MASLWAAVFARTWVGFGGGAAGAVGGSVAALFAGALAYFELSTAAASSEQAAAIPVTVVTGWLGAGKTTMISHLLRDQRNISLIGEGRGGRKILVVENEVGSVGVDHDLLVSQGDIGKEEVVLLRNGCVCCSVRADLGRVLREQLKRNQSEMEQLGRREVLSLRCAGLLAQRALQRLLGLKQSLSKAPNKGAPGVAPGGGGGAFDHIIVETSGVAAPSPIIQLFFADPEVRRRTVLDAVVCVVDARHVWQHLRFTPICKGRNQATPGKVPAAGKAGKVELCPGGQHEVLEQIAYADRVIVNKADLVEGVEGGLLADGKGSLEECCEMVKSSSGLRQGVAAASSSSSSSLI